MDLELILSPGVNGIIGLSEAGKTNILRAINWLINNRPLGGRIKSKFDSRKTIVGVQTVEGIEVVHTKEGSSSSYRLRLPGQKNQFFTTVKSSVPEEVLRVLSLGELNIQSQLAGPFLVGQSPPEVARTINRITKAERINEWIKRLNSKVNLYNVQRKAAQDKLSTADAKLKAYKGLDEVDAKIERLEKIRRKIIKLQERYDKVDDILAKVKDAQQAIKYNRRYKGMQPKLIRLQQIRSQSIDLAARQVSLESIINLRRQISIMKDSIEKMVDTYVRALRNARMCPTCFKPVNIKDMRKIENGIRST